MPEYLDMYDQYGNRTGKTFARGDVLPEGCYGMGVQVWVRNDRGEFLLSQRHPRKSNALCWEPTNGAVDAGEDSRTGGVREVVEELGIALKKEKVQRIRTRLNQYGWLESYMAVWNGEIGELKLCEREVVDAKWATYDELLEMESQGILLGENRYLFRHVPSIPAAICPMYIQDYQEIHDMWMRIPGMGLNNLDDSREGIEKFLRKNPNSCFVARMAQGVVGAILCGHDGRRGHLYHAAVVPECRGMGLGRALVQSALDALKEEGIAKASLVAFADNQIGLDFWTHIGFNGRDDIKYLDHRILDMVKFDVK